MFIKTHEDGNLRLTFIKSENVQVFPSGRRGAKVENEANIPTNTIPFDPEARLNTEANNRKQSGLSGYTQEYLKDWSNTHLTLSLAGYLFDITHAYGSVDAFGQAIITALGENNTNAVYANILIEKVRLYSGELNGKSKEYYTSILRDQSDSAIPATYLDLPNDDNNYYFSGLSFSVIPLTSKVGGTAKTRDSLFNSDNTQQLVSLCILEKVDSEWKIHQPALLPNIEHDTTQNSIVVGDTRIKRVENEGTVVDNYNGDLVVEHNITVEHDLTVNNDAIINKNLTIDQIASIKEKLIVGDEISGTADSKFTVTGKTTLKGNLSVSDTITVGTPTKADNGYTNHGVELKEDGTALISNALDVGNKIITTEVEASSVLTDDLSAHSLYQKVNDTEMQVPIIELEAPEQSGGFYQLKITRIGVKSAN